MKIETATRKDAEALTVLTIESKSYWGYGHQQIEAWRDELTITPAYIDENFVYKLVNKETLIGFYAYNSENEETLKLNFLFIAPEYIGKGYGKLLLNDFLARIQKNKYKRILLDADPNAQKFYEHLGFKVIGKLKSSIKDRFLPIMEMKL